MGWRAVRTSLALLSCGNNGCDFLCELVVRLNAIAVLQYCVDFCNQEQARARFFLECFIGILDKECEVALVKLAILAAGISKLNNTCSIAAVRHAAHNGANVVRVASECFEIATSELSDTVSGVARSGKLLIELVSKQSIQAETMVRTSLENVLALDSAGIMFCSLVNAES